MRLFVILAGAVAAVGIFLLATASAQTTLFARHYPLLLGLNATLAILLAGLVGYQLLAMARRYRARVFGTRLTLRLLARFALLAVLPGLVVYAVSVHFVARSIESWFDLKVDAALEGGITIGQQAIDQMLADLQTKARAMALDLDERPGSQLATRLERMREQVGVEEVVLLSSAGRPLASASADVSRLVPDLPSSYALRQARVNRGYTTVDSASGRPLSLRVLVPVDARGIGEEPRVLQLRQTVSPSFSRSAEAVEAAYRDYRELAISREGLKRIYIVTLTFALFLALFIAVSVAVTQSNLLAEPLAILAQATQAVARGEYSRQAPVMSRDELGVLTESFNSMTRQLSEARRGVEANRAALEEAKAHLENILANLSAGVIVFDHELQVSITNRGAHDILGADVDAFAADMRRAFAEHGDREWQVELTLKSTGKTVHARGARLSPAGQGGHVVVFDDVTQLIQAQRATAWAEVARRLAHEIKNPLTPIQLSAERLEMKLAERLSPEDADALRRATTTIVSQVSALKAMVDDFRDYARMPPPSPAPIDINALVGDVLALYETSPVPIAKRLQPGLPLVWADPSQIRQVIHNLVQNAQEALENAKPGAPGPAIEVRTERVEEKVRLAVSDNGGGFPDEMMARIFEPYATTKARGTGLGLAIVKKIVDEHHGSIAIENRAPRGVSVSVLLPLARVA